MSPFSGTTPSEKPRSSRAFCTLPGATTRPGKIEEGTCPTDFDGEEIERRISINLSVAHAVHRDVRINFLDAPGYGIFSPEARSAAAAADAVIIVLDAVSGVEVQTEKAWKFAAEFNRPVLFVVNRMDRERASFDRVMETLQKRFGRGVVALQIPVRRGTDLQRDGGPRPDGGPLPRQRQARGRADPGRHRRAGEGRAREARRARRRGRGRADGEVLRAGNSRPCGPAPRPSHRSRGAEDLPRALRVVFARESVSCGFWTRASPSSRLPRAARSRATGKDGKPAKIFTNEKDPAVAQIIKTVSDPFAGRISYLRIRAGHFQSDGTYCNATRGIPERFSGLFLPQGKEHVNVPEAKAGDIVAVAKLKESTTGDTLTTKDHPVVLPKLTVPEASIAYAIEPKAKGDEDKISTALHKLIEEDPSLHFQRDDETKEFHLSGASQLHVEIAVARLKKRYGVEVILHPPKVPYRETIKGKAEAHGRHKKQSGGHGQFADCKIKVEPLPRGGEFEFVDDIYGGSIPRNFIPAVEKGIQEARRKGFLAGYPMVDFRVILYDGQYHDVDSSELAFKIAGALAYRRGDGEGEAHPARAHHERRGLGSERVRGRLDGRPLFAPRPCPGDGVGVRRHRHQGAGSHVGNADVRRESAVDHPGPRDFPHGVLPLRRGAARLAGKDHQPVQGGEGSRGERLGKISVGAGLSPPALQPPPGLLIQQPQERPAVRPHP